jgi:pyrimidine operon attenuation protein/uracil phosphoribosyltransferase
MNTIDKAIVEKWIIKMTQQLRIQLADDLNTCVMIGIHTGGVRVAQRLHQALKLQTELGELNISFYRDDFSRIGLHPTVGTSTLQAGVDNKTIILVDDVIHSGRTIRAAMNEIFDYGRPARIILATLVERDGRELPIRADIIGQGVDLQLNDQIKLHPDEMSLLISQKNTLTSKVE